MEDSASSKSNTRIIIWLVIIIVVAVIIFVIIFAAGMISPSSVQCSIDPPTSVSATILAPGKVQFSWSEVVGADSYCIYIGKTSAVSPDAHEISVQTSTNPLIWELAAPGQYFFVVTAKRSICSGNICGGCESIPSNPGLVEFTCDLPGAPVIFEDTGIVNNQLFISWFPQDGATEYKLYFKELTPASNPPSPVNFDTKITVEHPTWWYVFQIPPQVIYPYSVVVTACNDCGEGPASEPYTQILI